MDSALDHSHGPTLAEQFAAACDWWREAGVDLDFTDEPQVLLTEKLDGDRPAPPPIAKKQAAVEPEKPRIGGDRAAWPASLEGFLPWWMAEPTLDAIGSNGRVPPRGVHGAELMIIVPMPEQQDGEVLLGGAQGKLVAGILRAMGIAESAAYVASALPRHMPHADWEGLARDGLGEVLSHHVTLAAPKRLLVLGRDILTLMGQEKRQGVCEVPLNDASIQLLAGFAPENLLENARLRADLWRRWLDWTGTE